MTVKINDQIVDCEVMQTGTAEQQAPKEEEQKVVQMHERLKRPPRLEGATYKIRTPLSEHSLYVTINDIVLNPGTKHELRRPFEIFINSKNMDHFQWIVALTRILSAVFRKGGDVTFMVEELRSVFDPRGGYFKKGGRFMPSLVAEIGDVLEHHLKVIGILRETEADPHVKEYLQEKKAALETESEADAEKTTAEFPDSAQLCAKCYTKAVVYLDGCLTCLSCGDSKCG